MKLMPRSERETKRSPVHELAHYVAPKLGGFPAASKFLNAEDGAAASAALARSSTRRDKQITSLTHLYDICLP